MTLPRLRWLLAFSVAALLTCSLSAREEKPVFDRGEKYDAEHGNVYKDRDEENSKRSKKAEETRTVRAVKYHIKNLRDPDPDVRRSSVEMLAVLGSVDAVPPLIEVLHPDNRETETVRLAANGALAKLTGKNFGSRNYHEWLSWWVKNKEEFLKQQEHGVDEKSKIAAEAANTIGIEMMRRGEYRQAQQQFLTAVDKNPTVPDYRNNLGRALLEQGRCLDAIEYFEEVIGLDADLPQPYMNIGRCYSRMDKSIEAAAWYKKASERDKDGKLWDLFWMIGKEHMKLREWTLAYEYLDTARVKAERRVPPIHEPLLHKDLAITHYGLDQYHSAWKEIANVRTLGYDVDPGFAAKARKALVDAGYDPDEEDRRARKVLRGEDEEEDEDGPLP